MTKRKGNGTLLAGDRTISMLPVDVVAQHIFTFLSLAEACKVRTVSKTVEQIVMSSVENYFRVFEAQDLQMHDVFARALVRRMHRLSMVKLSKVSPEVIQDIATRAGPKLRILECTECVVVDLVIASVARTCLGLEVLRLSSTKSSEPLRISDISLVYLAKRAACASFLREVSIQNAPGVTEHGLSYILSACPRLKVLKAVQCRVGNQFELPSGQHEIPNGARMECLDLSSNHELTMATLISIPSLEKLRVLKLAGASRINDATLQQLSVQCPNLEELSLANCSAVTDDGLGALATGLCGMRLKHLDVARCSRIADSGLNAIARFGNLIRLDAQGCFRVTDYALRTLGAYCHGLEYLNLKGMGTLTDAGMDALSKGCNELRVLCIASCSSLSDASLVSLSQYCPLLERLDVFCVHRITDEGMMALVKGCPLITCLDLSYCFRISSDFLSKCHHRKFWKRLGELQVTGLQETIDLPMTKSLTKNDLSPLFTKKLASVGDTYDDVLDSSDKKRGRRRSTSLARQDSNSSMISTKKTPVPGVQLDVAGSPRAKLLSLAKESMTFLSLNEVIGRASDAMSPRSQRKLHPTSTGASVIGSRRFGDLAADIDREKAFAHLDDV